MGNLSASESEMRRSGCHGNASERSKLLWWTRATVSVTDRHKVNVLVVPALVLTVLTSSPVFAGSVVGKLPQTQSAFASRVDSLATQASGERPKIVQALRAVGFECNPASAPFKCIRLECTQRAHGSVALLQWFVGTKPDAHDGLSYVSSFIDYGSLLKCKPNNDLRAAERKILAGESVNGFVK